MTVVSMAIGVVLSVAVAAVIWSPGVAARGLESKQISTVAEETKKEKAKLRIPDGTHISYVDASPGLSFRPRSVLLYFGLMSRRFSS
jgi:hypothetical protein